jgi:hypothetical protein
LYIFDGFDVDGFTVDFDFRFFFGLQVLSLHPHTGFGGQVHAFKLWGYEGIYKKVVQLGSVYAYVQMVADGGDFYFDRRWLDADFVQFWEAALYITSKGISPSRRTQAGQAPQRRVCPTLALERRKTV